MAPEQLSGGPIDARTDIYALACVAYDLLTGTHLFGATNIVDLIEQKMTMRLPPRGEIGSGISAELYEFLESALRVNPAERLASVASLVPWAAPCEL
jgi:serine/threonine-protein kinase